MSNIPKKTILEIVKLLNSRGFVIDSDVESFCRYTKFDEIVSEETSNLQLYGYKGGDLVKWSTSFQGPTPAYGVYDSTKGLSDEDIIEYCKLLDIDNHNDDDLLWDFVPKLKAFKLELHFHCPKCSHEAFISPSKIERYRNRKPIISGLCESCGEKGVKPNLTLEKV